MRELIPVIEEALGSKRLERLNRDEDARQDFWVGVFEAIKRVDWDRDAVAYLITAGYGAVRNARRAQWTDQRFRHCPQCGRILGYRTVECPACKVPTESEVRHSEFLATESRDAPDVDLQLSIQQFVDTLSGTSKYIARRWMIERADLTCQNHTKQIAFELGLSAPRVAQIKKLLKAEFQAFLNR